jgi:capsular polysaccharide biosynthesis protein
MQVSVGIVPLSSLIASSDPSVRLSVEYEKPELYPVPRSIAHEADLNNPAAELQHQFVQARSVCPPGRSLTYLRNCIVLPNAAIVTSGGAIIQESCFPYSDRKRILRMFHPWIVEEGDQILIDDKDLEIVERPTIYVREHGEMGFFHWMHSVLPRIDVIYREGIPPEYQISIPNKARFQTESLALLDLQGRKIASPPVDRPQFFKELLFPSPLVLHGDFWLRPPSVKQFYANIPIPQENLPKRLYITRQDAAFRRLSNEEAIISLLEKRGFSAVELGKLPFAQQVASFRQAELVVGVHGAGLSHVVNMFSTKGLLEILHPRRFWATYRALASRGRLHYAFTVGEDPGPATQGDSFDFEVDPVKLEFVLDELSRAVAV